MAFTLSRGTAFVADKTSGMRKSGGSRWLPRSEKTTRFVGENTTRERTPFVKMAQKMRSRPSLVYPVWQRFVTPSSPSAIHSNQQWLMLASASVRGCPISGSGHSTGAGGGVAAEWGSPPPSVPPHPVQRRARTSGMRRMLMFEHLQHVWLALVVMVVF